MLFLIWSTAIVLAFYLYLKQTYSLFKRHGIKHYPPVPFIGNMLRILLKKDHITDDIDRYYFSFPGERFVGKYEFMNPQLVVRDLELVKKITIKDFEYFLDHRAFIDEEKDPLFGKNLFFMRGQKWKDMRCTISPAFTSSKMRHMVPFMVEAGNQMNKAVRKNIKDSGVDYIDVDIKDLMSRYANDVVASCAFGLKVDSHAEVNSQFYEKGKEASASTFRQMLIFFVYSTSFPRIMKLLNIKLMSEDSKSFFRNLVSSTMQERAEKNIFRPDMIHLLMEAKKGKLAHEEKDHKEVDAGFATVEESSVGKDITKRVWTDDELTAQTVVFFFAGFEAVSSSMAFLLHELALNPEVQERLVREIRENDTNNEEKFDFTSIQNMTYLDMVVSEMLRCWPPGPVLDRVCARDYNIGKPNDKTMQDFVIRKGMVVNIPAWSFHHDPQYFPEPEKFNPERFSEHNKHNIKPFSYMPFGLGPRNCIASRFALCKIKVMVYQLLREVEVSPCEKTCIPIELATDTFQLKIKGGHWLKIKLRA